MPNGPFMDQPELWSRLGAALAIGLLIGLERGWSQRDEREHTRAAGFRTFALAGLLGGLSGLVWLHGGPVLPAAVFLAFGGAFALFHRLEAEVDHNVSVTSVIAGLATFLMGLLAVIGDIDAAIASAVVVTGLLALREPLHRWVAALTWPEIRSVLTLLAMTFLLLPLLPNHPVDPWGVLNPYEAWLLIVLIAAVSFTGYIAVKVLGQHNGILVTAIAGGLASSTATTLALAKMGRQHPQSSALAAGGILLAGLVMMLRVIGLVGVLDFPLLASIAAPLAAAAVVLGAGAWWLATRPQPAQDAIAPAGNPLALATTLRLGALLVAILLVTGYLHQTLGAAGALWSGVTLGLVDVDGVAISMARLARRDLEPATAAAAILAAVGANTAVKTGLAAWTGTRRIGLVVGGVSLAAIAAATAAWFFRLGA